MFSKNSKQLLYFTIVGIIPLLVWYSRKSEKQKIIMWINSHNNLEIYNSLVFLDYNLNILGKYNKNKLVPFGEFLPFENFLSKLGLKKITLGYQSFSSG